MGQERKFSWSRLRESWLWSLPCPRLAAWSQEVMEAQALESIAVEAGLEVSHPKSYLVSEQVLMATVSSFHQELLIHWRPLDIWIKYGFLLQKILHLPPSPGLQGAAQPHAWAQPNWAGSSLRSHFARAKPALKGNVPAQQPCVGSGCGISQQCIQGFCIKVDVVFPMLAAFAVGACCGLRVLVILSLLAGVGQ